MSSILAGALSLENENTDITLEDANIDLAVEQAAGDIERADRSVEMSSLEQEELESAAMTMESVALSLEEAIADETGLSRREAAAHRQTIQAVLGDALPMPVASLESFGGDSERFDATQLSLEGIKDTIMKIWNAIKRAVANAIRAVADFFAKLFGGAKKLREKAEATLKKVEDAEREGKTLEGDKVEDAKGLDRIHYMGKTGMVDIAKGMKAMTDQLVTTTEAQAEAAAKFYKELAKGIKDRKENADLAEAAANSSGYTKSTTKSVKTGAVLPGGKQVQVTTNKSFDGSKTDGERNEGGIPSIKLIDVSKNNTPSEKFATGVKLGDLKSGLNTIIALLKKMEDAKKAREALKDAREDVVKESENLAKDAEKLADKAEGYWTQARISTTLRLANMDLNSNISRQDAFIFGYARGFVAFADDAVGKFKEKKAA